MTNKNETQISKGKAIALLSGGLDSILAIKVIMDQGIEVFAVNFTSPFCLCNRKSSHSCRHEASFIAKELGIPIKIIRVGNDYLDIIKNPQHGYGKNMNPCIDCRIYMHKKAKVVMHEMQADFIVTGEILGQRPMSQRRDALNIIDRDSDLKGLVLRPLSAKAFSPTIPEINGLIDREKLLHITGRSRKPQIELAKKYDIHDYSCAAGGCLLTDIGFSKRLKDLLINNPDTQFADIQLLKIGRHHRLPSGAKLVVGRNQPENLKLLNSCLNSDILLQPVQIPGATGLLRMDDDSEISQDSVRLAAQILLYYCGFRDSQHALIKIRSTDEQICKEIDVQPVSSEFAASIRL
ncbi:MAG: hypothetical protein A2161_02100 [Candidatus Schekmanbacteria bacterium RBG_13_48_7]|uniref:Uncharacterized protein n=1 Tax=Candidatus Schekmanbacteria bacterium RBG_13_48_7 TaxID=1817878 RepID=A0A1F7RXC0_9BACT|nr:MAG: hypothetical protein A2161_02100 [Candidatus Schekmanbacteria bacterium RBG_13_48_7]